MHVGVHIDWDLLMQQLVFAVQLRFFALQRVVNEIHLGKFVSGKTVFLSDVVELHLSADCLADDITQLVHVGVGSTLDLLLTLVDDDWHYKWHGCWDLCTWSWNLFLVLDVAKKQALLVNLN